MTLTKRSRSSLLRSERKEIIPSPRRWRAWANARIAAVFMILLAVRSTTFADSATWRLDPGEPICPFCWGVNYPNNWTLATVPNGWRRLAQFCSKKLTDRRSDREQSFNFANLTNQWRN
jgi:hypothetical protein